MKLHKGRKGQRVTNYGDRADTIYVIISGRIAVTAPRVDLKQMIDQEKIAELRDRTAMMT